MKTPLFEQISDLEKDFLLELTKVPDETVWGVAIAMFLENPTPERFKRLIKDLKSQAKDCADTMISILGKPCYNKLLNLQS